MSITRTFTANNSPHPWEGRAQSSVTLTLETEVYQSDEFFDGAHHPVTRKRVVSATLSDPVGNCAAYAMRKVSAFVSHDFVGIIVSQSTAALDARAKTFQTSWEYAVQHPDPTTPDGYQAQLGIEGWTVNGSTLTRVLTASRPPLIAPTVDNCQVTLTMTMASGKVVSSSLGSPNNKYAEYALRQMSAPGLERYQMSAMKYTVQGIQEQWDAAVRNLDKNKLSDSEQLANSGWSST